MNNDRVQKLLWQEEFEDLEDIVVAEGAFVQLEKNGDGVRQVFLGLTPESFIAAEQRLFNYKEFKEVYFGIKDDPRLEGLYPIWVIPLCFVNIEPVPGEFILKVTTASKRVTYYELCTIDHRDYIWDIWLERLRFIRDDPYGQIERLHGHYGLEFEKIVLPDREVEEQVAEENKEGSLDPSFLNSLEDERKNMAAHDPTATKAKSKWKTQGKEAKRKHHPLLGRDRRNAVDERSSELAIESLSQDFLNVPDTPTTSTVPKKKQTRKVPEKKRGFIQRVMRWCKKW